LSWWTGVGASFVPVSEDSIDSQCSPILERLSIEPDHWGYLINHFESRFKPLVGGAFKLKRVAQSLGYQRTSGIRSCEVYFS